MVVFQELPIRDQDLANIKDSFDLSSQCKCSLFIVHPDDFAPYQPHRRSFNGIHGTTPQALPGPFEFHLGTDRKKSPEQVAASPG